MNNSDDLIFKDAESFNQALQKAFQEAVTLQIQGVMGNPPDRQTVSNAFQRLSELTLIAAAQVIMPAFQRLDQPLYWDNRAELKAVDTYFDHLIDLNEDALYRDSRLLSYYIILTYALEYYAEIPDLVQKLKKARPSEDAKVLAPFISRMANRANANLSLPRFTMDFQARVAKYWDSISALLKDVEADQLPSDSKAESFMELSSPIFQAFAAYTGLSVLVLPPDEDVKQIRLCFALENYKDDYYAMQHVIDCMPPELDSKLACFFGHPSTPIDDIDALLKPFPDMKRMRFHLQETPMHLGVIVEAYGPSLKGLKEDGMANAKLEIEAALTGLLGRDAWNLVIAGISIQRNPQPPEDAVPLEKIPAKLQEMEYSLEISDEAFVASLSRSYSAPRARTSALREDITAGTIMLFYLQLDYYTRHTVTADRLLNMGVVPCFLAMPKSIMPDGDTDAFDERFVSHLREQEAPSSCIIIGRAESPRYCYIDMLVWSIETFVREAEAYFSQIPGGDQVILQCFRYGSKPGPVAASRMEGFSDTANSDTAKKITSNSAKQNKSDNTSKAKLKNRRKAKNKGGKKRK